MFMKARIFFARHMHGAGPVRSALVASRPHEKKEIAPLSPPMLTGEPSRDQRQSQQQQSAQSATDII